MENLDLHGDWSKIRCQAHLVFDDPCRQIQVDDEARTKYIRQSYVSNASQNLVDVLNVAWNDGLWIVGDSCKNGTVERWQMAPNVAMSVFDTFQLCNVNLWHFTQTEAKVTKDAHVILDDKICHKQFGQCTQ